MDFIVWLLLGAGVLLLYAAYKGESPFALLRTGIGAK